MLHSRFHEILLALGSNASDDLSESYDLIESSIILLYRKSIKISNKSVYYQTPAFPAGAGPDFVNCVLVGQTDLSANELMSELHTIEADLGRKRLKRWGQRTLDIDLLDYDCEIKPHVTVVQEWMDMPLKQQMEHIPNQLILPHPRIQDRAFVLVPMADVAPNWCHPILNKTTEQMRDALPPELLNEIRPFVVSD